MEASDPAWATEHLTGWSLPQVPDSPYTVSHFVAVQLQGLQPRRFSTGQQLCPADQTDILKAAPFALFELVRMCFGFASEVLTLRILCT